LPSKLEGYQKNLPAKAKPSWTALPAVGVDRSLAIFVVNAKGFTKYVNQGHAAFAVLK
jgi:hypothetical protein